MSGYVVVERDEAGGYSTWSPDLPGCVAADADYDECLRLMVEAVRLHVEGMRADGEPVPEPLCADGSGHPRCVSQPEPEACDAATWLGARTSDDGVVERSFQLMQPGGVVPGVVWLPVCAESSWPLVALGHGGSGHKRNSRNVDLGHWFASRAGIAAVAIDGPHHGDRAATPLAAGESRSRMVSDWNAVIAAVRTLEGVDAAGLGYLGLSMGTRFGLPLGAALGDELSCAVFGKFGLRAGAGLYEDPTTMDDIKADARQISAPTLLHVQWDDELFPRDGQFALFESLGSREKQLIAFPGSHGDTAPTAPAMWCDFIRRHLRPA